MTIERLMATSQDPQNPGNPENPKNPENPEENPRDSQSAPPDAAAAPDAAQPGSGDENYRPAILLAEESESASGGNRNNELRESAKNQEDERNIRLEFYRLITGDREAATVPEDFSFSPEIEKSYQSLLARRAELIEAFKKECEANKRGKGGKQRSEIERAEAEIWRMNAEKAYQLARRELEKALLEDFLKRKKERYPELTEKDLKEEALYYSSRVLVEAIKNIDLDLELRKIEILREMGDRSRIGELLRRYGELSRGKKLIISAAVSAGVGAMAALLLGPGGLLGMTVFPKIGLVRRFVRSLGGGSLAAAITSGAEKFWLRGRFAKQREEIMRRTQGEVLRQLSEQLSEGEEWLKEEAKKEELFEIVEEGAKNYRARLNEQARKEGRTRMVTALAAGLIGGLTAAGLDWYALQGASKTGVVPLQGGSKTEVVQNVTVGRPKVDIAQPEQVVSPPPEQVAAAGETIAKETAEKAIHITTIKPGDSLWKVTRGLIKEGVITEEQWKKAWGNSMVEIISHGKKIKVPISEIGLIHSGDQVVVVQEGDKIIFEVVDYAKDNLKLGSNEALLEIYKKSNKPIPKWLEEVVRVRGGAGSVLEKTQEVIHSESLKLNQAASVGPEALIANPPPARLLEENQLTKIIEEFKEGDFSKQQEMLYDIGNWKKEVSNLAGLNPPNATTYLNWSDELTNLENVLRGMPEYARNLEIFNSFLEEHNLNPLFTQVKLLKVEEFLAIAQGTKATEIGHPELTEIFERNQAGWFKLAGMIENLEPGRPERKLSLGRFLEEALSSFNLKSLK